MVQSINTKVDLVEKATSHTAIAEYGKIMIGDKGFEFFNDKNVQKYIQIPWDEVDLVIASILFKGKYIPRYALKTKSSGTYNFSSKDPKKVLRAIREYIPADRIVRSLSFFQVLKRGLKNIFMGKRK
ncbi:hypothetical protein FC62_GL000378 [Amylolactobacillus amylotrophicus DSM 20534]|uniref:Uncharacterized protein n=4 Tax=Amylolactobacillus TaxID=2767876 RepID=A0A0R1YU40_9LACO|nr:MULTISPECIES: DUF956 family protein [Amylolactobacillus]APT19044.1 hypothetical protein LA20533_07210 [Amylolactobacillus amylophilus DSM 20533 = JCM 1125]KRK38689.1 hypothetical protein FC62_GL000378 [Amylolactobacillus amylotrophicus DSM 20534]KRM42668.1 hypothetical protein FD40_GL000462 [Amylolactobacillus amylophilus DSM 20533 = JCM 1125]